MWLVGRLAPDFKTIADFRKDNGAALRAVCRQFVELCRQLGLFTRAVVAIDGSKFKAVNNRDKNYTVAKVTGRMEQVDASIARYLRALDRADREESDVAEAKSGRLKEKIAGLRQQMQALKVMEQTDRMQARLDRMPEAMCVRRQTVEHPFGTLKAWMGATHFLTRPLDKVRNEMSLHVLAYNFKRMITIFGVGPLMAAIRA